MGYGPAFYSNPTKESNFQLKDLQGVEYEEKEKEGSRE